MTYQRSDRVYCIQLSLFHPKKFEFYLLKNVKSTQQYLKSYLPFSINAVMPVEIYFIYKWMPSTTRIGKKIPMLMSLCWKILLCTLSNNYVASNNPQHIPILCPLFNNNCSSICNKFNCTMNWEWKSPLYICCKITSNSDIEIIASSWIVIINRW